MKKKAVKKVAKKVARTASPIDAYLARVPAKKRALLEKLREAIRSVVPSAEECISYCLPAFRVDGRIVAGFAATAKGGSSYPFSGTTLATLADELAGYEGTKSALHFREDAPLPVGLVRKLIRGEAGGGEVGRHARRAGIVTALRSRGGLMVRFVACAILGIGAAGCGSSHHHASSAWESHHEYASHSEPAAHTEHADHAVGARVGAAVGELVGAALLSGGGSEEGGGGTAGDDDESSLAPFDEVAAQEALNDVVLDGCARLGAPRGEGRARVTFRLDGAVTVVEIQEPQGLAPAAVECIGDRLRDASAPPFRGAPVDVSDDAVLR